MNKVEKIKTEIERKIGELKQFKKASYEIGLYDGYMFALSFIDSLSDTEKDFGIKSNELEEAAHSYVDTTIEWFDSEGNPCCYPAFIAGAQWQKQQDQLTIELAEDHAMLAGMEKMRQEMMKNVVLETKVMKDNDGDGVDTPYEEWLTLEDTEIPFIPNNIGLKDGDKVKLIIIREE